jgi:hypothetical protein
MFDDIKAGRELAQYTASLDDNAPSLESRHKVKIAQNKQLKRSL